MCIGGMRGITVREERRIEREEKRRSFLLFSFVLSLQTLTFLLLFLLLPLSIKTPPGPALGDVAPRPRRRDPVPRVLYP